VVRNGDGSVTVSISHTSIWTLSENAPISNRLCFCGTCLITLQTITITMLIKKLKNAFVRNDYSPEASLLNSSTCTISFSEKHFVSNSRLALNVLVAVIENSTFICHLDLVHEASFVINGLKFVNPIINN